MNRLLLLLLASSAYAEERSAVHVVIMAPKSIKGGSGTVVHSARGESFVLTNKHVVEDIGTSKVMVITHDDTPFKAEVLNLADRADLAMLRVKGELVAAKIAETVPPTGTVLHQWGYSGWQRNRKEGPTHPDQRATVAGVPVFYVAIDQQQGDSGAGQFDKSGKLVAVNWGGRIDGGVPFGSSVGLAEVRAFVAEVVGR